MKQTKKRKRLLALVRSQYTLLFFWTLTPIRRGGLFWNKGLKRSIPYPATPVRLSLRKFISFSVLQGPGSKSRHKKHSMGKENSKIRLYLSPGVEAGFQQMIHTNGTFSYRLFFLRPKYSHFLPGFSNHVVFWFLTRIFVGSSSLYINLHKDAT